MAVSAPFLHREPRIDAYIAKAAPFARPILAHLRDVVHGTCPDVEESMKWSMPFFSYRGTNLAHMAAFKAHCAFGLWRAKELGVDASGEAAMGSFGRVGTVDDLPPKRELARLLRAAMKLNEAGAPTRAKSTPADEGAETPADFAGALAADAAARARYAAFTPGARREYIAWITEAKREATRASRIASAVAWIAEGKKRNWKYER